MTWLIEHSPYWVCASCLNPAPYKPGEDCEEAKHKSYYAKKIRGMRRLRRG